MFARFSTLLLVLSLLNAAFAWAPRTPTSTKPISASDLKLRQNSREKIIQRATAKRARVQIRAIQQEHKDVFGKRIAADPQHSPKVYPKCPGSKGLGYAHYYHWDYYSNDIPGNPRYAEQGGHNTEENCIALCSAHQLTPKKRTPTPDTSCIGVVYVNNGPCYLKGELFKYGKFQYGDEKHSVDLVGGCAAWASTVPADMDMDCCEL